MKVLTRKFVLPALILSILISTLQVFGQGTTGPDSSQASTGQQKDKRKAKKGEGKEVKNTPPPVKIQAEPSGQVYTIKQAVADALKNNPSLAQVREVINQDVQVTDLTRSVLFPNLSLTASAGSAQAAINVGGNPGATPLFNGNVYNSYATTLALVQPLYQFGALDAVEQVDFNTKIQKTTVEQVERTMVLNVVTSFYNIILNQKLLGYLIKEKEVLEKSLETTEYRERIGRAQLLDVLQVKTQIASIQPQIDSARNSYEVSAAQLASYLGISGQKNQIAIKGSLKTLLLKDVEKYIDYKKYYLPELEANRLQILQIADAKNAEDGKYLPTLKLQGNYMFNAYTASDLYNQNNNSWNAGLYLSFPIFEGLAQKYDMASFASQEQQLYDARRNLENTLSLNQITSRKTLDTMEISMVSAVEADRLAQASLVEATRQYRLATIDFLNYLTIQNTALTAASSLDQIKYNSIIAYANYFIASGQPLSILLDLLVEEKQ